MIRAAIIVCVLAAAPVRLSADASLIRLYDLLAMDDYIEIARAEGLADAEDLSREMLGRPADAGLLDQISRVYDLARMKETVLAPLSDLEDAEVEAAIAYFQTDAAVQITELEVAARRAMSDDEVEQSARRAWVEADRERPRLVAQINEMSEVNDLVERNVAGALNSNLRYFQGLADGDGLDMTEDEILIEVWAQEPEIRAETEAWLGGYFLLAYDPLEAEALEAYVDFWRSDAGQALNTAIFAGFNQVYDDVSYATGRIIALHIGSRDL